MNTKTTLTVAAASIALVLMTGGAFAKTFEAVYTVSIHKSATKSSRIVDKLFEGERVKVQECDDTWCLINHEGPDGWVPMASLERIGGTDDAPTIIFQGGGNFTFPHQPKPPIVVDPGPHKPPFGQVTNVGNLPVSVFDPVTGGGNGGGNGGGGVHPVGPVVNPGGSSICDVKPQFCQPGGNNPGGLGGHGLGGIGGLHF